MRTQTPSSCESIHRSETVCSLLYDFVRLFVAWKMYRNDGLALSQRDDDECFEKFHWRYVEHQQSRRVELAWLGAEVTISLAIFCPTLGNFFHQSIHVPESIAGGFFLV
jgi:hypothetical protein